MASISATFRFPGRLRQLHSTHSPENRECANTSTAAARAGLIETRTIEQYYDPVKQLFLPDRFIKGECPKCGAKDQYGDNCESCGAAYAPTDLKIRTRPSPAPSRNCAIRALLLQAVRPALRSLPAPVPEQRRAAERSRQQDAGMAGRTGRQQADRLGHFARRPYFGFEIPDAPGKYFYVWLDAPIGYMGSFKNLCARQGLDFDEFFKPDSQTELYHFIGKDILYFHALFWPAELQHAGYRTPTKIFAHGFLTVDGAKMSKSRGTFITAESYLNTGLNPEWLRYYFAAKLSNTMEDIDLNLEDFVARVNSDLVGKYVNIASRSAGFIAKRFNGQLAPANADLPAIKAIQEAAPRIAELYEAREFGKAMREIMALTDGANQYVDSVKPWELAKQEGKEVELHAACSNALNLFRLLTVLLKPSCRWSPARSSSS
jgi:methionyl-tRNA synthetase